MFLCTNIGDWRFVSDIAEHTAPLSRILISSPCQCIVAGSVCGIVRFLIQINESVHVIVIKEVT